MMNKHLAFASLLALMAADLAFAQSEPFRLDMCESRITSGWSFYCRPPESEPEKETVAVPQAVPQAPPPVNKGEVAPENPATEAMMAYRALIDETKYRAVLDPTEENVRAYMEINKEIGDRAGAFTDQWQRILFETPHLNANVDSPLAEAGIGVYQDQMLAAREATFQRVANEAGILFIFEADQKCGICRVQGQILTQLEERYGVNILAVSMDGGGNASFPNAYVDNGRLQELGLEDYPAPTLALADPETGGVAVIGSGLITADEILERVFVITEIPVGERY